MTRETKQLSPEALMCRFKRHLDERALDELVERFLPRALAVARQLIGDPWAAEDAVQETFLRIVRERESYDPTREFAPWFYAILRNVCFDIHRRRIRDERLTHELRDRASVERRADAPSIDALDLLDTLPPKDRAVLSLRILHRMSFREIAQALDIGEEAAKKRAQRALRKLRRKLVAAPDR